MSERSTNFALLCELLEVSPKQLSEAVGADTTLVSRWRTGNRKLMPGRHWANRITEYMLVKDEQSGACVCDKLLRAYFPDQSLTTPSERARLLMSFLTMSGQTHPEYLQRRFELLSPLFPGRVRMPGSAYTQEVGKPIFGVAGLQSTVVEFLAIASKTEEPVTLAFACPAGLGMLIGDETFALRFLDRLTVLFERGYRLEVCLSSDDKPAVITQFTRRWMWLHMCGYIKSYYYELDARSAVPGERMMAAVPGHAAFSVIGTDQPSPGVYSSLVLEAEQVDGISERIHQLITRSRQLIHCDFFRKPEGYLGDVQVKLDQPAGKIAMMPHFGISPLSEYPRLFGISEAQIERIQRDFAPLLITPDQYAPSASVRYIFCQDEIEEQLMKNRHGVPALSEMLDKQIYMTTRMLAKQLKTMRELLISCRNFEVAFIPRFMMEQFTLQIHVWGSCAAIGTSLMADSSACVDRRTCSALGEQLESIWDKLPFLLRSRAEALKKLSMWLEKARRYGVWEEK